MVHNAVDIADRAITTTPRTLLMVGASLIAAYAWALGNFATVDSVELVAVNLQDHMDEQTIWRLETKLEDIGDKRWLVHQAIARPGGDTQANRQQAMELEGREKKVERSLGCIRTGGKHCINGVGG